MFGQKTSANERRNVSKRPAGGEFQMPFRGLSETGHLTAGQLKVCLPFFSEWIEMRERQNT